MPNQALPDSSLPSGWAKNVKPGVLHVISLAHYAIVSARGWAANSINARVRLTAENDLLKQETQLLREELRIKDARVAKLNPRRRPYTTLAGRTPDERYRRVASACRRPRWEPRPLWPNDPPCASPQVKVRGKPGVSLQLVVDFQQGRKHLPIVALIRAP